MQNSSYLTNNFGLLSDVNERFVMIVSTKCRGAKGNSLIKNVNFSGNFPVKVCSN